MHLAAFLLNSVKSANSLNSLFPVSQGTEHKKQLHDAGSSVEFEFATLIVTLYLILIAALLVQELTIVSVLTNQ